MNPRLDKLHAYPFERLARLKSGATPPAGLPHIAMSIGEPQHTPPAFVLDSLRENLHRLGSYPATAGLPEFRASVAWWLQRRFDLPIGSVNPDTWCCLSTEPGKRSLLSCKLLSTIGINRS